MRPFRLSVIGIVVSVLALSTTLKLTGVRTSARDVATNTVRRPPAENPSASNVCERRRFAFLDQPAALVPPIEQNSRAEIMARTRAEAVVFFEPPTSETLPAHLASLRSRLLETRAPWQALHQTFSQLSQKKELRRVILSDGYLYAETPRLAVALGNIPLARLFDEQELDIFRGNELRHAKRKGRDYVWMDGSDKGQPAHLWLYDRVSVHGEHLGPPKHVTLNELQRQNAADRIEIERATPEGAAATLVYGTTQVPALLSIKDGKLQFDCATIPSGATAAVDAAREVYQRRERVLERLRAVIAQQVEEALPFDEPKTEEGQQDGQLRVQWRYAYQSGQHSFEFNGDEYPVFGVGGIPRTPQVCVDFITDSWERMAGTHFTRSNERRQRQVGRLDLDTVGIDNRRRVQSLIDFAVAHPEWFEAKVISESERVRFADRAGFFRSLLDQRDQFRPGDVVAILGPRNDETLHYHSFFIYAADPVTGMPTLVAANAGHPRIRTWEGEMQNAPLRSIMARIRPRLEWLEAITGDAEPPEPMLAKL
jgi:hypothetical protein